MSFDPKSFDAGSFSTAPEVPELTVSNVKLKYNLQVLSKGSKAIVIFVHGRGSGWDSERSEKVAEALNKKNVSTLMFDLQTVEEKNTDSFDVDLLSRRVEEVIDWVKKNERTKDMKIGLSGSSEGAALALVAAAHRQDTIDAIVLRGALAQQAEKYYDDIVVPTLLIVGEKDRIAKHPTEDTYKKLMNTAAKDLQIIPKADHLFKKPDQLEQVVNHSVRWFTTYLLQRTFVPLLRDIPTDQDRLARRPFAKHLAIRLKNIYDRKDVQGAFMLHIHGHWGSGKSSLLELLEYELNGEQSKVKQWTNVKKWFLVRFNKRRRTEEQRNKKWFVVRFNAWEHERSGPSWWTLMNSVYNQSVKQLPFFSSLKLRFLENVWRVRSGLIHRLFWPLVILACIIAVLLIADTQALIRAFGTSDTFIDFMQNKVGLIVATLVAIVAGIITLSTSLAPGSARAANQFIDTVEDPTSRLSSHFKNLKKWIGHPIIVFIDDLDRCQHNYTVEILERIQTLFRDVDVIYVVAADRRWIYTSYEKAYETFKESMNEPGRPLRFMFLEKIFQLSMYVPHVDPEVKEEFWRYLLSKKSTDPNELAEKLKRAVLEEEKKFDQLDTATEVLERAKTKKDENPITKSAKRGAAIVRLASFELETDIERSLVPFAPLVDSNPRLMKRVVNAYTMALATQINSGIENIDNTGRLALKAILSLRWPRLDEYLEEHPNMINYIGNKTDGVEIQTDIPSRFKSTIPNDVYNLFYDKDVINVVKGKGVNVSLEEGSFPTWSMK
jgi:alpha-beta hydrolase superfamily lysophospholipase